MWISPFNPYEEINQGALFLVNYSADTFSNINLVFLCYYKYVAGYYIQTGPSITCYAILDLLSVKAIINISRAAKIVDTPIVIAYLGTFSIP